MDIDVVLVSHFLCLLHLYTVCNNLPISCAPTSLSATRKDMALSGLPLAMIGTLTITSFSYEANHFLDTRLSARESRVQELEWLRRLKLNQM